MVKALEEGIVNESAENSEVMEAEELEKIKEAIKQRKPYTFVLRYPTKFGSEEIRELVLHRPKLSDMRKFVLGGQMTYGDVIDFAARMCRRDPQALNEFDIVDANRLVVAAGFFCALGLKTGGQ